MSLSEPAHKIANDLHELLSSYDNLGNDNIFTNGHIINKVIANKKSFHKTAKAILLEIQNLTTPPCVMEVDNRIINKLSLSILSLYKNYGKLIRHKSEHWDDIVKLLSEKFPILSGTNPMDTLIKKTVKTTEPGPSSSESGPSTSESVPSTSVSVPSSSESVPSTSDHGLVSLRKECQNCTLKRKTNEKLWEENKRLKTQKKAIESQFKVKKVNQKVKRLISSLQIKQQRNRVLVRQNSNLNRTVTFLKEKQLRNKIIIKQLKRSKKYLEDLKNTNKILIMNQEVKIHKLQKEILARSTEIIVKQDSVLTN